MHELTIADIQITPKPASLKKQQCNVFQHSVSWLDKAPIECAETHVDEVSKRNSWSRRFKVASLTSCPEKVVVNCGILFLIHSSSDVLICSKQELPNVPVSGQYSMKVKCKSYKVTSDLSSVTSTT